MTDVGRMSFRNWWGKVLPDEHADVLRQAVGWLAQQLMEAEVTAAAGAGYGERSGERWPGPARSSPPRTIRDRVVGSDGALDTRGVHPLKGVEGGWQLFTVTRP
jgi:hypothetical protein